MTLTARLSAEDEALDLLASRPLVVLTGAGLSTDSGIPDYRGPGAPTRAPMTYQEFVGTAGGAAALLGAQPPRLAADGPRRAQRRAPRPRRRSTPSCSSPRTSTACTRPPGHGASSRSTAASPTSSASPAVRRPPAPRSSASSTPSTPAGSSGTAGWSRAPTATSTSTTPHDFVVPRCPCGGPLKPDVVFFGENVPADRVARCYAAVEALGSSRGAARRRVVADGDERAAVRQAGGPGRDADRHREPWRDPRRRAGVVQARGRVQRVPDRARRAGRPSGATKMCSAASTTSSAVSPPEPMRMPSSVRAIVTVLPGSAPTRRSRPISSSSFCISSEIRLHVDALVRRRPRRPRAARRCP